jgi:DNA-binding transcriptional ArsR family regulator
MQDALSQTFAALADPTRRAILARLRHGDATVTQLAEPFLDRMSLPGVTKHLKVLETAGLVSKGRDAQWRPCTLNPAPLKDVAEWMEAYRVQLEASLDRLDVYLRTLTNTDQSGTNDPSATDLSPRNHVDID